MVKQTVILRKRANPKIVNLPNGRSFTSRWETISRKHLNQAAPALRTIKKRRENEILNRLGLVYDRVNQSGQGLASNLEKAGIELGTKALGSDFGKKINK